MIVPNAMVKAADHMKGHVMNPIGVSALLSLAMCSSRSCVGILLPAGSRSMVLPPSRSCTDTFFLADHAQEYAHIDRIHQHDVAFYMIGCLDHCIRDNHMPMAMSTLLPCSRQRKDTSDDLSHDIPLLLCAAAFHDRAETYSATFET